MGETITIRTGAATDVIKVIEAGPQGPAGASQGDVLTTQGDLLYRGASSAARLGIGTAGQILKVNAGATAPEWGAAPASGVSSVAGRTGDVTLAVADVTGAVSTSRQISAGTGLTGGGDLTADRTLTVSYGTTAGTATQGNDTRIVNILKSGEADGAFTGGTGGSVNLAGGSALAGTGAGGAAGSIDLSGGNAIYDAGEEQGHAGTAAGSIDLSGRSGGGGGSITMRGALIVDGAAIHSAGSIDLSAGGAAGFGNSSGGSIVSTGGSASGQNGGTLNMSGGSAGGGGSINTSNNGGLISSAGSNTQSGGSLNLSAGAQPGGSINTSDGGGSINTRGTGSIGLGVEETRTTLSGTATDARAILLPNASGTLALTSDFAAPPAIGNTTPAAISGTTGTFTTLTATPSSGSALTLTGGTVTASAPLIDATQTWNNGAVTFTGLAATITNTASAAGSLVARLTVGSTNVVETSGLGNTTFRSVRTTSNFTNILEVRRSSTLVVGIRDDGDISAVSVGIGGGALIMGPGTSGLQFNLENALVRDAAHALAIRGGTNSQEQRLYSTFTSSTNYQRMTIKSVRQTLSALSGASATTTGTFIPDGAVVVGVTTRVSTLLTGATGYTIGDGTDADRWGDITGTAVGTTSDNRDWTAATIECFTAGGNITLTAKTSNFTAGAIEICVFYLAGEAD
jgi:hypothetical protein